MPPIKGKMLTYSEDSMLRAYEEAKSGLPIAAAARKHNVPYSTLAYKVNGKTPLDRRMGPKTFLSSEQENTLVKWILSMVKAGFPVTIQQLQDSVCKMVTQFKIETPFKDNRPGRHWFDAFQRRHPQISLRTAQNLTESRAAVTYEALSKWFAEVNIFFDENDLNTVISCNQRVFNCDETAFFLNPKGNKVLAPKGDKNIYQKVNADEKECLTVFLTGNAAGDVPPPMIVFQYERIPRDLALSVPKNWGIGRSESGWMTGETFFEFVANIFNPWINENNIQKPIILFIDGHTSHLTLQTSQFCSENGIVLIALHPNATHLIQPMDVSVFRSLKLAWKSGVHDWRLQNIDNPRLRKIHFSPLLEKVLKDTLKPSLFENGFRKCGLCPWNIDELRNHKFAVQKSKPDDTANVRELNQGLAFIEKYIGKEKITMFKNRTEWSGPCEDKSLFEFWKMIKSKCDKDKNYDQQPINPIIERKDSISEADNDADAEICSFREPDSIILSASEALLSPSNVTENFLNSSEVTQVLTSINCNKDYAHTPRKEPGTSGEPNPKNIQGHTNTPEIEKNKTVTEMTCQDDSRKTINGVDENNINVSKQPVASTSNIDSAVPTPFKTILFWPKEKYNTAKKRKTEKIPAVVTSEKWQEYYENKEMNKKNLLEQKEKRAEERQRKKKDKDEAMKIKQEKNLAKKTAAQQKLDALKMTKKVLFDSSSEDDMEIQVENNKNDNGEKRTNENDKNEFRKEKQEKDKSKAKKTTVKKKTDIFRIKNRVQLYSTSESEAEEWVPPNDSTDDLDSDDYNIFSRIC